jgi:hypothetical protein
MEVSSAGQGLYGDTGDSCRRYGATGLEAPSAQTRQGVMPCRAWFDYRTIVLGGQVGKR